MDHKLQKFLGIVEAGGFTKASQKHHISQPALSVTVSELEKELGVPLLNRSRGHFGLTDAGKIVYEAARRMRLDLLAMEAKIADQKGQQAMTRIGLLDTLTHLLLRAPQMQDEWANLELTVDNSSRLTQDITTARLDVAIIAGNAQIPVTVAERSLMTNELFIFVGSPKRQDSWDNHSISDWLAFNQASNTYAHFVRQFADCGIRVVPTFYSTSMDLLKTMAMQGHGVALLPAHFCYEDINAGKLARLGDMSFSRPLMTIWSESQRISSRADSVVASIMKILEYYQASFVEPPKRTTTARSAAKTKKLKQ